MTTLTICAVAYADSQALYANSAEEMNEKMEASHNEEFELQFIDGSSDECAIAELIDLDMCNLEQFFDLCEQAETEGGEFIIKLSYLMAHVGCDLENALEKIEDVSLYHGKIKDYAYECAQEMGLEAFALRYFDAERFANDLECGGDVLEADNDVWVTNHNNL